MSSSTVPIPPIIVDRTALPPAGSWAAISWPDCDRFWILGFPVPTTLSSPLFSIFISIQTHMSCGCWMGISRGFYWPAGEQCESEEASSENAF